MVEAQPGTAGSGKTGVQGNATSADSRFGTIYFLITPTPPVPLIYWNHGVSWKTKSSPWDSII